jgi:hypothetical protein
MVFRRRMGPNPTRLLPDAALVGFQGRNWSILASQVVFPGFLTGVMAEAEFLEKVF